VLVDARGWTLNMIVWNCNLETGFRLIARHQQITVAFQNVHRHLFPRAVECYMPRFEYLAALEFGFINVHSESTPTFWDGIWLVTSVDSIFMLQAAPLRVAVAHVVFLGKHICVIGIEANSHQKVPRFDEAGTNMSGG
jgi:hypothetical protein